MSVASQLRGGKGRTSSGEKHVEEMMRYDGVARSMQKCFAVQEKRRLRRVGPAMILKTWTGSRPGFPDGRTDSQTAAAGDGMLHMRTHTHTHTLTG